MSYKTEAQAQSHKAILTIGAREGYEKGAFHSQEELTTIVKEAHREIQKTHNAIIPCKIRESKLIGIQNNPEYEGDLYDIEFLWSPRFPSITQEEFSKMMENYTQIIGRRMGQVRIYLELSELKTIIYKNSAP